MRVMKRYLRMFRRMDTYAEMVEKYDLMAQELAESKEMVRRLQADMDEYRARSVEVDNEEKWKVKYPFLTKDIRNLDFTVRTTNVLLLHGLNTMAKVIVFHRNELKKKRHLGGKCLLEIETLLDKYGLELGTDLSQIPE